MPRSRRLAIAVAALIGAVVIGLAFIGMKRGAAQGPPPDRAIGLFTSLPLVWPEGGPAEILGRNAPPHWAMAVLRARGAVVPLDRLASDGGSAPLDAVTLLVMAQPRPLAPDENVALDEWVRGGGGVLLFADPMLTAHSAFALGDPRRPQDTVLLSPILARWGLRLEFDEAQPPGERRADMLGMAAPVDLPGRFAAADGAGACVILSSGLVARCAVGRGRIVAVSDAALLDDGEGDDDAARAGVLSRLLTEAGD